MCCRHKQVQVILRLEIDRLIGFNRHAVEYNVLDQRQVQGVRIRGFFLGKAVIRNHIRGIARLRRVDYLRVLGIIGLLCRVNPDADIVFGIIILEC